MNHHEQVTELFKEHFKDIPITGIEIGTAEGCLTKTLLMYLSNLERIYSIDPYLFDSKSGFEAGKNNQEWHDDRRRQAEVALTVYEGRYTHLCIPSDEAIYFVPSEVDFVWIDGDHTLSQVQKDVLNYYPRVKSGGIFGGHDWNLVIKLVKELITEPVTLGQDWTWWAIKK